MKLWVKILIGMAAGVVAGIFLDKEVVSYIKPFGTLFLRLISMLVVPIVFCSVIAGVTSIKDTSTLARVGAKTIAWFFTLTLIASVLGIVAGLVVKPGLGVQKASENPVVEKAATAPSITNMLIEIVPKNPVEALATGNVLQIIFFAMLLGIAAVMAGERSRPFVEFNNTLMELIYKVVNIVMLYAPIGVFALMAAMVSENGAAIFGTLLKLSLAMIAGLGVQVFIVFGILLLIMGLNPARFFRKSMDAITLAFSTASSSATLPVTTRVAIDNIGISKGSANFIMPLGVTMNKTGSALWQSLCAIFAAQIYGIDLTFTQYGIITLVATLVSMAAGAIPSGGLVVMSVTLSSVGLPLEVIAIVAGIDRILDMFRTMVNVLDDLVVGIMVDISEKKFDMAKFKL